MHINDVVLGFQKVLEKPTTDSCWCKKLTYQPLR